LCRIDRGKLPNNEPSLTKTKSPTTYNRFDPNPLARGVFSEDSIMHPQPDPDVTGFFMGLDSGQRWLLVVVAMGCAMGLVISLVSIVMSVIGGMQRHRAELELKREMLERGMSAEEIERVIAASKPAGRE